jgi:hypothetical protein
MNRRPAIMRNPGPPARVLREREAVSGGIADGLNLLSFYSHPITRREVP